MAGAVHEGDMAEEPIGAAAALPLAGGIHLLVALEALVASWSGAGFVVTFVDLCVCVAELDGDVAFQLVLEPDGLYA